MKRPALRQAAKKILPKIARIADSSDEDEGHVGKIRVVTNFVRDDGTVRTSVTYQDDDDPVYLPPQDPIDCEAMDCDDGGDGWMDDKHFDIKRWRTVWRVPHSVPPPGLEESRYPWMRNPLTRQHGPVSTTVHHHPGLEW